MTKKKIPPKGDTFLRDLNAPAGIARAEWTDSVQTGLVFRVTETGSKSWRFEYRVRGEGGTGRDGRQLQGKNRRITLGRYPSIGLAEARRKAEELRVIADEGTDPGKQQHSKIAERRATEALTFGVASGEYLSDAEKGRKVGRKGAITPTTASDRRKDLDQIILPILGDIPLADITRQDLVRFLDKVEKDTEKSGGGETRVDRILNVLRGVFYFATEMRHYIDENPAGRLKGRVVTASRDRVLEDHELTALWLATGRLGAYGRLVRVLLLTGQRRGEVAGMVWGDLDLETGVWRLPAEKTKARRVHAIPLPEAALNIIQEQGVGQSNVLVFPGDGGVPMSGWNKRKARLDREIRVATANLTDEEYWALNLNGKMSQETRTQKASIKVRLGNVDFKSWRLHDLRRTMETGLARLRTDFLVSKLIINHDAKAYLGVTDIYNKYAYADEIHEALERWARHLLTIVGSDGGGENVIELDEIRGAGEY